MTSQAIDKVDSFFANYPMRTYPKGQILVFADEEPSHIFFLLSGRVRVYDISYRGDEVIVNLFQPPAFFPMSWAINKTHNGFFYSAETQVVVRAAPPGPVMEFVKKNPDVMFDLLSRVYYGMDGLFGRVVQLMSGTARSRLAYELIIETWRFGQKIPTGEHLLDVSEADLAARSGMSRETVSREFSKLAREYIVQGSREGILIKNLEALRKIAGTSSLQNID